MASQGKAPWLSLCFGWTISEAASGNRVYYHSVKYVSLYIWVDLPSFSFYSPHFLTVGRFFCFLDNCILITQANILSVLVSFMHFTLVLVFPTCHRLIPKCLIPPVCAACCLCLQTVCIFACLLLHPLRFRSCWYLRRTPYSSCNETRRPIGRRR